MITVKRFGLYTISLDGHSGYAEAGSDIVCGGISALAFALAEYLSRNNGQCETLKTDVSAGHAYIYAEPVGLFKERCKAAFDVAMCGMEQIAQAYPDYVTVTS